MEENLSEKEDGQVQERVLKEKKHPPKSLQGSNVDVHQLLKAKKKPVEEIALESLVNCLAHASWHFASLRG